MSLPRTHRLAGWSLLFVTLLAAGHPRCRAADDDAPQTWGSLEPRELIRRAAARDAFLRQQRKGLLHDEEIVTEQLDAQGQVSSTRTARRRRVSEQNTAAAKDGLRGEAGDKPAAKKERDARGFQSAVDLGKIADRFELRREPDGQTENGRPCYVVNFQPKTSATPARDREELILSQLSGRFWLDQEDLSIVQSEGHLTKPVTVAWVASVYRLSFRYRSQAVPGIGQTVPESFVLEVGVKAPFYHERQRQTTSLSTFKRGE